MTTSVAMLKTGQGWRLINRLSSYCEDQGKDDKGLRFSNIMRMGMRKKIEKEFRCWKILWEERMPG